MRRKRAPSLRRQSVPRGAVIESTVLRQKEKKTGRE